MMQIFSSFMVQGRNLNIKFRRKERRRNERRIATRRWQRSSGEKGNGEEKKVRETECLTAERGRRVAITDRSIAVTSARNHSRQGPRKIRSPIVYIEIRSCRNAFRVSASMYVACARSSFRNERRQGNERIRDGIPRGIRKRSRGRIRAAQQGFLFRSRNSRLLILA